MPYVSASEVIIHEEVLYQVYVPLPLLHLTEGKKHQSPDECQKPADAFSTFLWIKFGKPRN